MNCAKCGISVEQRPLLRINETGVTGIFWCEPCIESNEQELYFNLLEDKSDVEKTLDSIFYPRERKRKPVRVYKARKNPL